MPWYLNYLKHTKHAGFSKYSILKHYQQIVQELFFFFPGRLRLDDVSQEMWQWSYHRLREWKNCDWRKLKGQLSGSTRCRVLHHQLCISNRSHIDDAAFIQETNAFSLWKVWAWRGVGFVVSNLILNMCSSIMPIYKNETT